MIKFIFMLFLRAFTVAVLVLTVLGGTAYYAREIEPRMLAVTNETIAISGLPQEFEEMKIVQISDLHGKQFPGNKLTAKVNALKPDILVITGDVLDIQSNDINYITQVLGPLKARFGKFFVYGNNEYSKKLPREKMDEAYRKAGVTVLSNDNHKVSYRGKHLWLLGVEDPNQGRDKLDSALKGTDHAPKILLAHSPEIINKAAAGKIDLVLAGHTHGGQIRIPGIAGHPDLKNKVSQLLVKANIVLNQCLKYVVDHQDELNELDLWNDRLARYSTETVTLSKKSMFYLNMKPGFEKYDAGLYTVGKTAMYVNRGLGESKLSLRLFSPPEISVFTLTGRQ